MKSPASSHKRALSAFSTSISIVFRERRLITFCGILLVACIAIGLMAPSIVGGIRDRVIAGLLEKISSLSLFETILFIFKTNLTSAFFSILLGVFLGAFPVLVITINGLLVGSVLREAIAKAGSSAVAWRVLPHGIFEIPAILIACALGIRIGLSVSERPFLKAMGVRYREALLVFVFVVLPLLLVAATIEGTLVHLLRLG